MASTNYLKVGTEPILVRITTEPYVILTFKGYAPVVDVIDCKSSKEYVFFISSKSASEQLEQMRKNNGDRFTGIEVWIRKESDDKMARYILEAP